MGSVRLKRIYNKLYRRFGKQNWWPAKTRLEVIIGAVLTQNTSWPNVEKAIGNLKRQKILSFVRISRLNTSRLAHLIRPAGYFNIKSTRLKNVLDFIQSEYGGSLTRMQKSDVLQMRRRLLGVNGVGPETADSILLYAFHKPMFVVDAYTRRIFSRLKIASPDSTYEELQIFFMDNLKLDTRLFNEYHALIVRLGKDYCKKNKPNCRECPIRDEH
jgi:endonuclease-3 related protein